MSRLLHALRWPVVAVVLGVASWSSPAAAELPTVISARAILPSANQACPKTVTFKYKISVPAAGTYYYRYVRSDGGTSSTIFQKTFQAPGEFDLPYNQNQPDFYWTLGHTYCGWTSIHFESVPTGDAAVPPSGALAHFTLNCPGDPNNATFPPPPDIGAWLGQHPTIANALKWQSVPNANGYDTPTDGQKTSYPAWTQAQKEDLAAAFQNAFSWLSYGSTPKMSDDAPLTDKPENLVAPPVNPPSTTVAQMEVKLGYGWKLYYESVAFALAGELHGSFPNWSILSYDADALAALFDSALMGTNAGDFLIGTYSVYVPANRVGNQAHTAYGPPRWIYGEFMKKNNLIGNTRLATIGNVLEWARQNLTHFYGPDTYQNVFDIWQYYGFPPVSSIIAGTTSANGFAHWTAGCHGSLGFYTVVLKAVNIPVRPVWVCGHELAFFPTEHLYMDHGDDPYNLNVKNSIKPMTDFLIDEATYKSWFTSDLTVNIVDGSSPACSNVGRVTTMTVGVAERPGEGPFPGRGPLVVTAEPNPSTQRVHLRYDLPAAAHARIEIFDLAGHLVETVFEGVQSAGAQDVAWSPDKGVGTGVYFARVTAGAMKQVVRVVRIE